MSIADNPLKLKLFVLGGEAASFEYGACTAEDLDPDTWFLDDAEIAKTAKGYCFMCPFGPANDANNWQGDDSCYKWAIAVEEQTGYFAYGIFGGRDAAERQRVLDLKRIAKGIGKEYDDDER